MVIINKRTGANTNNQKTNIIGAIKIHKQPVNTFANILNIVISVSPYFIIFSQLIIKHANQPNKNGTLAFVLKYICVISAIIIKQIKISVALISFIISVSP
jgi:hypothetical protein